MQTPERHPVIIIAPDPSGSLPPRTCSTVASSPWCWRRRLWWVAHLLDYGHVQLFPRGVTT